MAEAWFVLLRPDGRVLAVDGGAPAHWIASPLDACRGATGAVREAAHALIHEHLSCHRGPAMRRRYVSASKPGEPAVLLVLVEGVFLCPEDVDIGPLLRSALTPLRRQAEILGIFLRLRVDPMPPLFVDPEKIGWSIATLAGNALRHVGRGGRIDVSAEYDESAALARLVVSDDGSGVSPNVLPFLLEPDPRTGKPVGVALRIVQDFVAAHGGAVLVTPAGEERRGTKVTLILPARAR